MAKDLFHDAVRRGLEKDQWIITDDPLELEWEEITVKIDLVQHGRSSGPQKVDFMRPFPAVNCKSTDRV